MPTSRPRNVIHGEFAVAPLKHRARCKDPHCDNAVIHGEFAVAPLKREHVARQRGD